MVCMQDNARGVGRMLGDAEALSKCEVIHRRHLITSTSRCAALGIVKSVFLERP